jgi:restriction system protein
MARRKRSSFFEDLIDIAAMLPWWVAVLLAVISYLILHNIATAPEVTPTHLVPGNMGAFAVGELKRTLALFGQYIFPFAFSIGALLSVIRKRKDEETNFSSYSKQNTIERSQSPACPNCGSHMVKRKSKKGANAGGVFWGCSSFPKCYGKRDY